MLFEAIEKGLYWLSSFALEGDVEAHCQLRCPLTQDTLLTTGDDLMSVIAVRGSRKLIGDTEFEALAKNFANAIYKVFKSANGAQHSFAYGFRCDPDGAQRLLQEIHEPNRRTAQRLRVSDLAHLYDQVGALARTCIDETAYIVMYTHRSGLSPSDAKRYAAWIEEASARYAKQAPGQRLSDDFTQRPKAAAPALVPRHAAALENFIQDLGADMEKGGVGLLVEVLECGQALALMRRHLDASAFDSGWRPRLIGDRSAVVPGLARRDRDASHLFPMRIGRQLVPEPLRETFGDVEYVQRGNRYYGGVVVEVPPEDGSMPFAALAARIGRQIPYSLNIEVAPNGEKLRQADQTYAAFLGAMGENNRRVKAGWQAIKEMKRSGRYIAAVRMTFITWAKSAGDLVENVSFLRSSLEAWGSCTVTNETGNPGLLALCAASGFAKRMPAPYLPGPLEEFCRMLPAFRPASVWDAGQLVAHTKEGRPYPVGFGTTLQNYWGTLIFAPTGTGKSFLMNMINAGILLSPGIDDLPYLTIVDVGPSSRLVLDLMRALLPPRLARQIASIRVRNSEEFSVNMFDTQLGCDRPTEVDRDFQVAVVSTLCPTLGPEGERFIGQVINEAYKLMGRNSPLQRRWQAALDKSVSVALQEIGFAVTDRTFVWDVVDALFDAGRVEDAALAQRYAVPRLNDLIKAARAKEILDSYESAPSATSELMLSVFDRAIQTAATEFELIAGYTKFEVGSARAVSIDLEEVVSGTQSEEGKRRAAIMFLFGRRLGAKNYFLRWDELQPLVPDRYREYQEKRVKEIEESLKFLEYDEVHYASGIPSMQKRIQEDLRVGRKYKAVTLMASQLLADFPAAAVDNCYTYFILGTGRDEALDDLRRTFGLSESEVLAVKSECTSPGRALGLFKTTRGTTSQILHTTAGPLYRWAFSTSKDDALLRQGVRDALGGDYLSALKALARLYPSGSARNEMDIYRRSRGEDAEGGSVIAVFVKRVLESMVKTAAGADRPR